MDDARLVARALEGSEEAYRELVRRYQRPVFGLVARMVRDPAVAEELAQDTFVKAIQALATYDPARKFSSWLFKIAHNTTIDHLRRREPASVPLGGDEEAGLPLAETLRDESLPSPEAQAQSADLARSLEGAVRRLRPEYREVVLLRYQAGMTYEEIADVAGLPLGTVKTHLHRAHKQLAQAMTELGWGPEGGGAGRRRPGPGSDG